MKTIILALVLALPVSCQSPKVKALRSVDRIVEHVQAAQNDSKTLRPHVQEKGLKALDSMDDHLSATLKEAVSETVPNIKKLNNPEPWWKDIWLYAKILIGLIILFFLGNAGILPIVAQLISWMASKGITLSRSIASEAALSVHTMHVPEAREWVAAKRAARADFNGAFLAAKKSEKSKQRIEEPW